MYLILSEKFPIAKCEIKQTKFIHSLLAALQAAMQQQQASVQANALQMGNMRSQAMLASTLGRSNIRIK